MDGARCFLHFQSWRNLINAILLFATGAIHLSDSLPAVNVGENELAGRLPAQAVQQTFGESCLLADQYRFRSCSYFTRL
jgi:hypothetical protein